MGLWFWRWMGGMYVCSVRSDVSANLFNFFVCFFIEGNGGR